MAFNISIGDVMLLSSFAWKIGRAFTSGRGGAPAEFIEVHNELKGLSEAISSLGTALDEDNSILDRADDRIKESLDTILDSCRQTLDNLESLVDRYQDVIKSGEEIGGTRRRWNSTFIRNYKKMCWTSEGGNIQDLRNMLHMHSQSIVITMDALQSKSLSRLEKTIEHMAQQVEGIHNMVGSTDIKIAEMHNLMISIATPGSSPSLGPRRTGTIASMETLVQSTPHTSPSIQRKGSQDTGKYLDSGQPTPEMDNSGFPSSSSPVLLSSKDRAYSDLLLEEPALKSTQGSDAPPITNSYRWSAISDELPTAIADLEQSRRPSHNSRHSSSLGASTLPPVLLPSPALGPEDRVNKNPPSISPPPRYGGRSVLRASDRSPHSIDSQHTEDGGEVGAPPTKPITPSQQAAFQAMVFTNAATLCQRRGACVEYTQFDEEVEDGVKMVEACSTCTISIVTKAYKVSAGNMRYITSIWALSENRTVRLQQTLPDDVEIIPYTLWGNTTKVVVRMSAELKYHGLSIRDKPLDTATTDWVNYVFNEEEDAIEFQNTLMGKRLLHTFKSRRTLRLFDTIVSTAFAYQEQLCGLENLRLWSDDEEGDGSVLAMIQYSASFKPGYLAFRLRGPYTTVRIKDDGEKWVKVKGLEVSLATPGTDMRAMKRRKSSVVSAKSPNPKKEKMITGVRIEFESVADKILFLELYKVKPPKGRFIG